MISPLFLAVFASLSFVHSAPSPYSTLSQQCWHEYPLSAVNLQTSPNGYVELVEKLSATVTFLPGSSGKNMALKPDYGPWSYPPVCTEVLQSVGSKLCVYTNISFSYGRGISIFTTPKLAEEIASLPPFQDPKALENINVFSGNWYTHEVPDKGVGMLAAKQLKFKDRVTAYTPALLAYREDELPTMVREKFFWTAVSQLPETTRTMYLQLTTVYGYPQIRNQDIVKANTFQLEVAGQNHLAVFPETSRLNHACNPNAQYYLDPALLTHFVHATRHIKKGEEITICYTGPLDTTEVRQDALAEGFHFKCTCSRCAAKEKSDTTVREINDMRNALNDWSESSAGSPKMAEKLLQLYRKEGLEGFLDIPYGFAALAYNAVGNTKKAVKYAGLAQEIILIKDGSWTPNFETWREFLKDPKSHWSYKRRQRR